MEIVVVILVVFLFDVVVMAMLTSGKRSMFTAHSVVRVSLAKCAEKREVDQEN